MAEALTLIGGSRSGIGERAEQLGLSVALAFAALLKSGLVVNGCGVPVSWVAEGMLPYSAIPVSPDLVRKIVGSGLYLYGITGCNPPYSMALQAIDSGVINLSPDERYLRWRPS